MTIFKAFSSRTLLPVKIDEIVAWVKGAGFARDIIFHPMDRDPSIVAGLVRVDKYRPPYAVDDLVVADIPFSTRISEAEQRVTGAKEVLHVLERDGYVADTYKSLSRLVEEMAIPFELIADMSKLSTPGVIDHGGILGSLAILLPPAARAIIINLKQRGCIGNKEAAALANIPESYVEFLLSDRWEETLKSLCK